MADKNLVTWNNSYSVGIKLIDEQHMELINLTNRLFIACMEGQERSKNTFLDVIHETVDYVNYHFSAEEMLMGKVNYPEFNLHKNEHANFVLEVFSKVEDFKAGKLLAPLSFVYFLRDWVLNHIAMIDKKLGAYLLQLHNSGELQKISPEIKTSAEF